MLKRWLVKASETPPTSPILPDPRTAETPEKVENMVYANAEVVKSMTPKRKRGDYNYYDSADRAKMARYAVDHGVARAARHFTGKLGKNVNESTIRSLKKTYLKIVKSSDDSDSASNSEISEIVKKQRGPPTLIGKYEEEVKDYIESLRASGGVVNRPIVISAARGIIVNKQKSLLSEFGGPVDLSKTWAQSFLRRLGYVRRKGTKAARKVPEDFDMMKIEFLSEILKSVKQYNIPDDLIINFDQTNVMIIPVGDYTLDKVGSKQVSLLGLEDKRQITVLLACTLSGKLLPPQIIYQGKTEMCHPKYKFPDGWNITHSENYWSNGTTMLEYAENVLKPYVESVTEELPLSYGNEKALCIFDIFAAHRLISGKIVI